MASAPRRSSRSPQKLQPMDRPLDIFDEPPSDPEEKGREVDRGIANPFQKRNALRRSPPAGGPQVQPQQLVELGREAPIDPFKRGGLRRSGAGIGQSPIPNESAKQVPAPVVEGEITNPFEKRGLRRSDPRAIAESIVAMPPPPPQVQPRVQSRQEIEQEQRHQLEQTRPEQRRPEAQQQLGTEPGRQPRRSIATRQQLLPSTTTTPAPARLSNVKVRSVEDAAPSAASPPAAPTPEMVEEVNARAALRNQRLRGAQTRSPGQVDFGFNIPAAAPRPAPSPLAQVSAAAPAPAPVAATQPAAATSVVEPSPAAPSSAVSQLPAPFVASTPTPPTVALPVAAKLPLLVSQNTNSPLPAFESSVIATPTPTLAPVPAQRQRTVRAQEKRPAKPEPRPSELELEEPEEPTLPPTPKQRGIDDPTVTTKPPGIHDTPSKRLKRRTVHHSSPLKPQAERPSSRSGEDEAADEMEPANKRQRAEVPGRFTISIDPDAEKKKKRARMLAEIKQLESDIRIAERENERVRKATEAGKELKRPANADALVEMLSRVMDKPATFENPSKHAPSMLDNVNLFLPFSRPVPPKQRSTEEITKSEDLPSVLPVEVENPMPFLSAFTPFKFSSTVITLPPTPGAETGEADILQLHSITTTAPHCLFSSKLSITVNTRSGAVERCDIEYLDPAAERELGPWVRKRAKGGVLGSDVNSICWASTQWYEAALRRAHFFCQVESELCEPQGRDKARRRLRQEARRGRKSQPGVPQEPEEHFEDEEKKFSSEELRRNFGRDRMEIGVQGATLVINWKMEFDWTGEAEQKIAAVVKTPKRCKYFPNTGWGIDGGGEKLTGSRA